MHRSEVGARVKFAKKFPTEAELSTAVETHKSWTGIRQEALTNKPRGGTQQKSDLRRAYDLIENIAPGTLHPSDVSLIEEMIETLHRLNANMITEQAA